MMFLAEAFDAQNWSLAGKWIAGAAAAWAAVKYLSKWKGEIIAELRKGIKAQEVEEKDGQKREIGPQPFEVKGTVITESREAVIYATSTALAKIERETHDRLEKMEKYTHDVVHEMRQSVQGLTMSQNLTSESVRAMDRSVGELKIGMKELQVEGSRRSSTIHSRVDEINGAVERLDERTETTNGSLVILGQKVDRIVERLKA